MSGRPGLECDPMTGEEHYASAVALLGTGDMHNEANELAAAQVHATLALAAAYAAKPPRCPHGCTLCARGVSVDETVELYGGENRGGEWVHEKLSPMPRKAWNE